MFNPRPGLSLTAAAPLSLSCFSLRLPLVSASAGTESSGVQPWSAVFLWERHYYEPVENQLLFHCSKAMSSRHCMSELSPQ